MDEGTLAYLCGHSVVLYSPDTRTQRFVAGSPEAAITGFAGCQRQRLLALAERGGKAAITIFDLNTLKRRKIIAAASEGTKARPGRGAVGGGRAPPPLPIAAAAAILNPYAVHATPSYVQIQSHTPIRRSL